MAEHLLREGEAHRHEHPGPVHGMEPAVQGGMEGEQRVGQRTRNEQGARGSLFAGLGGGRRLGGTKRKT